MVAESSALGLKTRAIAPIVGVDNKTVYPEPVEPIEEPEPSSPREPD